MLCHLFGVFDAYMVDFLPNDYGARGGGNRLCPRVAACSTDTRDCVPGVFAPLLYAAAWQTPIHDFRQNLRPIGLLAVGLVLVTTLVVGVVAHALFPGLPWAAAFALGAIVSPPDAIAATAITQRLRVPRRISVILEGESLLNDAAGLVTYRVALAVAAVLNPNKNWTLAWRCSPLPTSIWMRKRFAALTKMRLNTCDPTFAAMPIAG